MDRQVTLLYKIEKQKCETWQKQDEKMIAVASDGEYQRPWCENNIDEDLLNLQIPLESTDLKIVICSDHKMDLVGTFPQCSESTEWKIKDLADLTENMKITASKWELNNQLLEHWRFPKKQFEKERYLYTYPLMNVPKRVDKNTNFPSWVDYQHQQTIARQEKTVQQQLTKKTSPNDENRKKNGISWIDLEYQKNYHK